jgi:hypothetical protein
MGCYDFDEQDRLRGGSQSRIVGSRHDLLAADAGLRAAAESRSSIDVGRELF